MYLYEKAREAHIYDLEREAEKRQVRAYLPQHRRRRCASEKLGMQRNAIICLAKALYDRIRGL